MPGHLLFNSIFHLSIVIFYYSSCLGASSLIKFADFCEL